VSWTLYRWQPARSSAWVVLGYETDMLWAFPVADLREYGLKPTQRGKLATNAGTRKLTEARYSSFLFT
jgi:hypothetical protein